MSTQTERTNKKKKMLSYDLKHRGPKRHSTLQAKPLCVAINRLAVDMETPLTFRTNLYKEGETVDSVLTQQEEIELLVAKFQFVMDTIRHNIKIVSKNGINELSNNIKESLGQGDLRNRVTVNTSRFQVKDIEHLRSFVVKTLQYNEDDKVNNIKSLNKIMEDIKTHPLCNNKILAVLTPRYNQCLALSQAVVESINNKTLTLEDLYNSGLTGPEVK